MHGISVEKEKLLNLLFPEKMYCHCCGDFIDKSRLHGLCDECISKIDWNLDNPLKFQMDGFYFEDIFCCCRYGFYPRKIIHNMKLYGKNYIAKDIGLLMAERVRLENISFDLVIPVPMAKDKLKKRGFNQAELLAQVISRQCKIKLDTDVLAKTKETASMRMAGADERKFMLSGAFELTDADKIKGRTVLIADDVVTTASTVNECAKVLKEGGASKVYAVCFAS